MGIRMGLETAVYRLAMDEPGDRPPFEADDDDSDETPESEEPEENENENEGGASIGTVIDLLGQLEHPIPLPPDTNAQNFLDRLNVALGVMIAQQEPELEEETMSEETTVVDPAIARMSLQAKKSIALAEKSHRATVTTQLEHLRNSGRCTPAEFDKYKAATGAIKLSLDDKDDLIPSRVETFIEDRASLAAGSCWDDTEKTKRLAILDHPEPIEFGEGETVPTPEFVDAIGKRLVPLPGD